MQQPMATSISCALPSSHVHFSPCFHASPPSPSGCYLTAMPQQPRGNLSPSPSPRLLSPCWGLQSNRNEFVFPSPCSQIWTIRHASALISFVLGFLEPFCSTAGEGFSFSSPVLCSLNKPGWRNTGGRVLNAMEKQNSIGFPLMCY